MKPSCLDSQQHYCGTDACITETIPATAPISQLRVQIDYPARVH
jgi:hypothetical protein